MNFIHKPMMSMSLAFYLIFTNCEIIIIYILSILEANSMILYFIGFMVIPIIMLGFGYVMRKYPPKKINGIYGYRTSKSMKSDETWKFAHEFCGRIWVKVGLVMLLVSLLIFFITLRYKEDTLDLIILLVVLLQTAVLLISIIPVEKALGNLFDNKGHRVKN